MSGKHDKSGDEEQAAKLLLTGPIVIRGLGRSMKDALLPGRPSRHRAFVAHDGVDSAATAPEVVRPTPLAQMLTGDLHASGGGPFSMLVEGSLTQVRPADEGLLPATSPEAQTDVADVADGAGEVHVDDPEPVDVPATSIDVPRSDGEAVQDDDLGEQVGDRDGIAVVGTDVDRAEEATEREARSDVVPPARPGIGSVQLAQVLLPAKATPDTEGDVVEPFDSTVPAPAVTAASVDADASTEASMLESENAGLASLRTDAMLAELLGDRGWTTAEELFSRQIALPAAQVEAVEDRLSGEDPAPEAEEMGASSERFAGPEVETASSGGADLPGPVAPTAFGSPDTTRSAAEPEQSSQVARRVGLLRERFGREAVGISVLVLLALVCGGLITAVVLKTRQDAVVAAREAAEYTPPPLATPAPASTGPVVAVIGDGTTSAAANGVSAGERWSALLAKSLGGTVAAEASAGMGYAVKGSSAETFVQAAARVPSDADVVIFFGGAEDSRVSSLSLVKAATNAYSTAKSEAPDAKLIVVGPAIRAGVDDADLATLRNSLRGAAAIAQATWVDPIDLEWLSTSRQEAASPTALSKGNEKTIAAKLQAVIKKALA